MSNTTSTKTTTKTVNVGTLFKRFADAERDQRKGSTVDTPSKRSNKNKSGRAGRKQHNGRETLRRVGGYRDLMQAIYAPEELMNPRLPHDPDEKSSTYNPYVPARLCFIRTTEQDQNAKYTDSPGIDEYYLPGRSK